MQTLTYKYKVYKQNRNHERRLQEWFRTAAWIYNHAIALQSVIIAYIINLFQCTGCNPIFSN